MEDNTLETDTAIKLKPHMHTNSESVRMFILYDIATRNHKSNVLSKFTILCWAAFIAILGYRLDTLALK